MKWEVLHMGGNKRGYYINSRAQYKKHICTERSGGMGELEVPRLADKVVAKYLNPFVYQVVICLCLKKCSFTHLSSSGFKSSLLNIPM